MRNLTHRPVAELESMDQLRGDCARMAPHWSAPFLFTTCGPAPGSGAEAGAARAPAQAAAPYKALHEALHGVHVPPAYARLLDGMSEYGD